MNMLHQCDVCKKVFDLVKPEDKVCCGKETRLICIIK